MDERGAACSHFTAIVLNGGIAMSVFSLMLQSLYLYSIRIIGRSTKIAIKRQGDLLVQMLHLY
jgi:hypothetical protein